MSLENRIFTLNKRQINKLINLNKFKGVIVPETGMKIVLPEDIHEKVVITDALGNHLGYISVKEAWSL